MPADRRQFLRRALASVALAPLAAPAVLPAAVAAPTPPPRLTRVPEPHDPAGPDYCLCGACCRELAEREDHGLTCKAILALDALDAALGRLIASHCKHGVEGCDICGDADGLRYVIEYGTCALSGQVIEPDEYEPFGERRRRARAAAGAPAALACGLALYDALDALLDLVEAHCPRWDCCVCTDADGLIHHVRAGIDLISGALPATVPMIERELLTARRKLARDRDRDGEAGRMPHAAREHGGAEDNVAHIETLLVILRARSAT